MNYVKPTCEVSQEEISEKGADKSILLLATKVISEDQVSFSSINQLANQAFRTSERTFCGELTLEFISDSVDYSNFLNFDEEQELITISPGA